MVKNVFNVTRGFVLALSEYIDIKPTMLLKVVAGAPVQLDLTSTFIYKKIFNAALMYRSGESVGTLIGITFQNAYMLGYSYDWTILNKTNIYHYGSHELIIRFDLALKRNPKGQFLGYF